MLFGLLVTAVLMLAASWVERLADGMHAAAGLVTAAGVLGAALGLKVNADRLPVRLPKPLRRVLEDPRLLVAAGEWVVKAEGAIREPERRREFVAEQIRQAAARRDVELSDSQVNFAVEFLVQSFDEKRRSEPSCGR